MNAAGPPWRILDAEPPWTRRGLGLGAEEVPPHPTATFPRLLSPLACSAAFHLLCLIAALVPLTASRVVQDAGGGIEVVAVSPEDPNHPGLNPSEPPADELELPPGSETRLADGGFEFDVAEVAGRARLLFPFLDPGLSLDHFALVPNRPVLSASLHPFVGAVARSSAPTTRALELPESALQQVVDHSWARRDRWSRFQTVAELASKHDPNYGQLPRLLHMYCEQNWLQPYVDRNIHDPRLWVQMGLAADHVDFISFISRFATTNPSTRATTELLFLLDKIAQASLDTLITLVDSDPRRDLRWTFHVNRDAYRLLTRIRSHYIERLSERGLTTRESLLSYYDRVRLTLLEGIVRTTPGGYRANDARYLMGAIYWREGKAENALRTWRQMSVDPKGPPATDSARLLSAIRTAGQYESDRDADDRLRREINNILRSEYGRWVDFSYVRLQYFGYRFDTF